MMRSFVITLLVLTGLHGITHAQVPSKNDVTNFNSFPKTIDLNKVSFLAHNLDTKLGVVAFLGTDCPISQKYMHTLRRLNSNYEKDISLFGVVPHHFSEVEIAAFKKEYKVPFPMVRDTDNELAKLYGATVTPEVFLFNINGEILYEGAIDNWFFALGRNRLQPSEHYLINAIESDKAGIPIAVSHTDAVGCFIEFKE